MPQTLHFHQQEASHFFADMAGAIQFQCHDAVEPKLKKVSYIENLPAIECRIISFYFLASFRFISIAPKGINFLICDKGKTGGTRVVHIGYLCPFLLLKRVSLTWFQHHIFFITASHHINVIQFAKFTEDPHMRVPSMLHQSQFLKLCPHQVVTDASLFLFSTAAAGWGELLLLLDIVKEGFIADIVKVVIYSPAQKDHWVFDKGCKHVIVWRMGVAAEQVGRTKLLWFLQNNLRGLVFYRRGIISSG